MLPRCTEQPQHRVFHGTVSDYESILLTHSFRASSEFWEEGGGKEPGYFPDVFWKRRARAAGSKEGEIRVKSGEKLQTLGSQTALYNDSQYVLSSDTLLGSKYP